MYVYASASIPPLHAGSETRHDGMQSCTHDAAAHSRLITGCTAQSSFVLGSRSCSRDWQQVLELRGARRNSACEESAATPCVLSARSLLPVRARERPPGQRQRGHAARGAGRAARDERVRHGPRHAATAARTPSRRSHCGRGPARGAGRPGVELVLPRLDGCAPGRVGGTRRTRACRARGRIRTRARNLSGALCAPGARARPRGRDAHRAGGGTLRGVRPRWHAARTRALVSRSQ